MSQNKIKEVVLVVVMAIGSGVVGTCSGVATAILFKGYTKIPLTWVGYIIVGGIFGLCVGVVIVVRNKDKLTG